MAKKYTTKTAALKATTADIRKLNINGSPFSKVVSDNVPETPTENDIWKYAATPDEEGIVSINSDINFDYSEMTGAQKVITRTAAKVIDNKVLDANDTLLMNWDTKNFTNDNNADLRPIFGGSLSEARPLTTFTSDLSSLTSGLGMFYNTSLASFTSDLSSLTNGYHMFELTSLTSFTSDLSSLTNGDSMFSYTSLASFTSGLSSLTKGSYMFYNTSTLKYFTSKLPSLINGEYMFYGTGLTSFTSDLSSLTNGIAMFFGTGLTSFTSDLSLLTDGSSMLASCTSLASFTSDLSSLTNGYLMFLRTSLASFTSDLTSLINGDSMFDRTSLASFISDIPSLTNGIRMFYYCESLESFTSDLSSLTNGSHMFYYCDSLTFFTSDLPSLTDGYLMFAYTSLASFTSDLSSLTDGYLMFYRTSLASFTSDLSSLVRGDGMFRYCKLDAQSVMFIIESIKDIVTEKASLTSDDYVTLTPRGYSKPFGWMSDGTYVYTYNTPRVHTTTISASNIGKIAIGIDITNDSSTIDTQLQEFAKDADYDSWTDLKLAFADKGWTVTWQYGGTNTSITLSADEEFRGVPVWAKIEEVIPAGETYTEEEKEKASYCTEDGSKYYNISWGHDVNDEAKDETMTDESKYFYFGSLLEACGYWGVIPKEYLEA